MLEVENLRGWIMVKVQPSENPGTRLRGVSHNDRYSQKVAATMANPRNDVQTRIPIEPANNRDRFKIEARLISMRRMEDPVRPFMKAEG
jgi:hypothetical protein